MPELRNQEVYRHIRHALGGELDDIQAFDVLEQAADWVSGVHSWRFLRPTQAYLKIRGRITITGATYTESSRTLTSSGAFDDYDYLAGDTIDVTAASTGDLKHYSIESKTDGDNIVLKSPGLGADATGVAGTMQLSGIALPSDFMDFVAISATNSIVNGLNWTTPEHLLELRTNEINVTSSWNYHGVLTWGKDANDAAVPILDIWPIPTTADEDAFTLFYRRRIVVQDEDSAVVPIPANAPLIKALLIRAARAIALGYEEGDERDSASMDLRLMELQAGPVFKAAIRQDGLGQPYGGPLKGGAVQRSRGRYRTMLASEIDAPT